MCSVGFGSVVGAFSTTSNADDIFYSLSIPSNFLSRGFYDMELEVPAQTTASINFLSTALLTFFLSLIIVDVDPELTLDSTLAPPFD